MELTYSAGKVCEWCVCLFSKYHCVTMLCVRLCPSQCDRQNLCNNLACPSRETDNIQCKHESSCRDTVQQTHKDLVSVHLCMCVCK